MFGNDDVGLFGKNNVLIDQARVAEDGPGKIFFDYQRETLSERVAKNQAFAAISALIQKCPDVSMIGDVVVRLQVPLFVGGVEANPRRQDGGGKFIT